MKTTTEKLIEEKMKLIDKELEDILRFLELHYEATKYFRIRDFFSQSLHEVAQVAKEEVCKCTCHDSYIAMRSCSHCQRETKSFFDLSEAEKKKITEKAAKYSNQAQRDLVDKFESMQNNPNLGKSMHTENELCGCEADEMGIEHKTSDHFIDDSKMVDPVERDVEKTRQTGECKYDPDMHGACSKCGKGEYSHKNEK